MIRDLTEDFKLYETKTTFAFLTRFFVAAREICGEVQVSYSTSESFASMKKIVHLLC